MKRTLDSLNHWPPALLIALGLFSIGVGIAIAGGCWAIAYSDEAYYQMRIRSMEIQADLMKANKLDVNHPSELTSLGKWIDRKLNGADEIEDPSNKKSESQ